MPKMKTKSGAAKRFRVAAAAASSAAARTSATSSPRRPPSANASCAAQRRSRDQHGGHVRAMLPLRRKELSHAKSQTWSHGARAPQEGPRSRPRVSAAAARTYTGSPSKRS